MTILRAYLWFLLVLGGFWQAVSVWMFFTGAAKSGQLWGESANTKHPLERTLVGRIMYFTALGTLAEVALGLLYVLLAAASLAPGIGG